MEMEYRIEKNKGREEISMKFYTGISIFWHVSINITLNANAKELRCLVHLPLLNKFWDYTQIVVWKYEFD